MIPKLERASFVTISKDFLTIEDTCGSNLNAAFVVRSFEKPVETLEEMLQR